MLTTLKGAHFKVIKDAGWDRRLTLFCSSFINEDSLASAFVMRVFNTISF